MTIQMNYLTIIEEITAYGHLIRMAIIPKFTLLVDIVYTLYICLYILCLWSHYIMSCGIVYKIAYKTVYNCVYKSKINILHKKKGF